MKNQLNDEEIDFNNLKNRIEKNREIEIKQLQSSKKKINHNIRTCKFRINKRQKKSRNYNK